MPLGSSCERTASKLLPIAWLLALAACGGGSGPQEEGVAASRSPDAPDVAAAAAKVTLSGLSSGAYMAIQTHMALADRVSGVAALAGGPYHCAQGNIARALGACLSGDGIDVPALQAHAQAVADQGDIAPLTHLAGDRVWVFQSPQDSVVQSAVGAAVAAYYAPYVTTDAITLVDHVASAHGWPTVDTGNACAVMGGSYLNACGFDAAGALLTHLYGTLVPRAENAAQGGTLGRVDLSAWLPSGSGLADQGLVFVPDECDGAGECRLHISFHGCQQGMDVIGDQFAVGAGLNEWAVTNRLVVLYPQVKKSLVNPLGCWDWWGYTGADYDLRSARQITAISNMISAFAQGTLTGS